VIRRGVEIQMSDEIEQIDGDEPLAPPAPPAKTTTTTQASTEDIESMSPEELREHLRKARKALKQSNTEAQSGREAKRRLQELEDEQERRRQSEMTELERLQKRLAEVDRLAKEKDEESRKNREELIRIRRDREVEDEARKLGANPRQASIMLRGMDNPGIDYDADADRFNGVKEAVKKLVADFPSLVDGGGIQRGRGTPPREQVSQQQRNQPAASQFDVDKEALSRNATFF
jgi:hypothetical protein